MFKTITVYSLREGTDPEEFLQYHLNVHAKDAIELSKGGMAKYIINQGVTRIDGNEAIRGLVEIWWKNRKVHDEYISKSKDYVKSSGMTPGEEFGSRGGVFEFKVFVEETEISTG